jgi:hypothetical protein
MSMIDSPRLVAAHDEPNFPTESDIRQALMLDLILPGPPVFFDDSAAGHAVGDGASVFEELALTTGFFELLGVLRETPREDERLEHFLARQCQEIARHLEAVVVDVWLADDTVLERFAGYRADLARDLPRREAPAEHLMENVGRSVTAVACDPDTWSASLMVDVDVFTLPVGSYLMSAKLQIAELPELGILNLIVTRPLGAQGDEILRSIADHLAQAIHAADARRTEAAHRWLAELGSAVGQSSCFLNELCADFLPTVFHCYSATALWSNQARDWLSVASDTPLEPGSRRHYTRSDTGLTAWVWRNARSLRVPDDVRERPQLLDRYTPRPDPIFKSSEVLPPGARRQFLGVPLCGGAERNVLGVLRLCGRVGDYRLSGRDERLANSLAPQIAQIYSTLRSIEMREQRLATQVRLTMELHSRRREEDLVHAVLTAMTCDAGLGFNRAAFFRFDEFLRALCFSDAIGAASAEEARLIWETMGAKTFEELLALGPEARHADQPFKSQLRGLELSLDGSQRDTVVEVCRGGRSSQLVDLAFQDPPSATHARLFEVFGDQLVIAPVRAKHRLLGLLCADNRFDRKPPAPLEQLDAFAQHLGMALELCRENEVRLLVNEFNARVAAILRERGEPRWMADRVLNVVRETLDVEKLALYHHESDVLRIIGSVNFSDPPRYAPRRQPLMDFMLQGRPFFAPEAAGNEQIDEGWRNQLNLKGPVLAFPLVDATSVSGLLVVNDLQLTRRAEATLSLLAPCLGNAVSHIALADKLTARERTISLLTDIPAHFGLAHDEEAFANRIAAKLREIVSGSHLCAIYCAVDDQPELFERIGYVGYPQEIRRCALRARAGAGCGLTSHVLMGQIVNVASVTQDARWDGTEREAIERTIGTPFRAFLGVPLLDARGRVMGAVTLTRGRWKGDERLAFTPGEVQQVRAIAQGIATIFEQKHTSSSLESQLRSERARAEALVDACERFPLLIQRLLPDAYPSEGATLRRVAHEVRVGLKADYAHVSLFDRHGGWGPCGESNDLADDRWPARGSELREQSTRDDLALRSGAECLRQERDCTWTIPLRAGADIVGLLLVGYGRVKDVPEDQKTLLEAWAALLASAIYARSAQRVYHPLAVVGKSSSM